MIAEGDAFCRGLQAEHIDQLVEEFRQPHFVAIQAQQAVFDPGDIEKAVDEVGKVLGAAPDDTRGVFCRDIGAALEELRVAED